MGKRKRKTILILGGAFGGLQAARSINPRHFQVTVVDRSSDFEFLPNIHELVSGVKAPDTLRLPIARIAKNLGHAFIQDEVVRVQPILDEVITRSGRRLYYDALLLAIGGVDASFGVEGVKENAIGFKSVDECHRIGLRLKALAEATRPVSVVIVGGGIEGVESLGEILRRHRRKPHVKTILIEAGDQLMPGAPKTIDQWIRKRCEAYNVRFRRGRQVKAIEPKAVLLDNGDTIPSDLTIWTGGIAPPPLLMESGLTSSPSDWLPCKATMQSVVHPNIFAAGDVAGLNPSVSKQAYHAMDQGDPAAKNIRRCLEAKSLTPSNRRRNPCSFRSAIWGDFSFGATWPSKAAP